MEFSEIQSRLVEDRPRIIDGYHSSEVKLIAKARRHGRQTAAEEFRKEYFYGRCKDKKTCIWPNDLGSWLDDSSGITWVGVHGNDSICVVTKAGELDLSRVHGYLIFETIEEVLCNFRRAVVSEIEDLVHSEDSEDFDFEDSEDSEDSEDHEDHESPEDSEDSEDPKDLAMCGKSIQLPFGVVSVVPLKVHKASSGEYQENRVMELLLESLEREENGQNSSDDDSEICGNDEDRMIKYSLRKSRRKRRAMQIDLYGDENSIRFLKKELEKEEMLRDTSLEEMLRDTSLTIDEAVQESIDEYDEGNAVEFLQEEVNSNEDFTLARTIKTAIAAFQHLFQKKFKATEIEVSVMDPNYFVLVEEAHYKDTLVKHLETDEIEEYLTEPGSGGSPMSSDGIGSSSGG